MTKMVLSLFAVCLALSALAAGPAAAKSEGLWNEHGAVALVERRKPRVPGGSGCDDPRDIIEHPECR